MTQPFLDPKTSRRGFLRAASAGVASVAAPALHAVQVIPFPLQPRIMRKSTKMRIGYFGDSTTNGGWYNGNPPPNEYSFKNLTSLIKAGLSDFGPIEIYQKGNNGESAFTLLNGAYISNIGSTVDPFAVRLTELAYDAVVVGVGICDAIGTQSPAEFQASLNGIFAAAKNAGIPLLFETPNPIPLAPLYAATVESYRPCFRPFDLLIDQNFPMAMSDGFHPTPASYDLKVQRVVDALRACMLRKQLMIYV